MGAKVRKSFASTLLYSEISDFLSFWCLCRMKGVDYLCSFISRYL